VFGFPCMMYVHIHFISYYISNVSVYLVSFQSAANSWLSSFQASGILIQPTKLAVLPVVLPHVGAITVETSCIWSHIVVYASKIFPPQICCASYEGSHIRTSLKTCCFDFLLGSCKNVSHATSKVMSTTCRIMESLQFKIQEQVYCTVLYKSCQLKPIS
jgi:hypothetical protein